MSCVGVICNLYLEMLKGNNVVYTDVPIIVSNHTDAQNKMDIPCITNIVSLLHVKGEKLLILGWLCNL